MTHRKALGALVATAAAVLITVAATPAAQADDNSADTGTPSTVSAPAGTVQPLDSNWGG
jgi:hypothetical protein